MVLLSILAMTLLSGQLLHNSIHVRTIHFTLLELIPLSIGWKNNVERRTKSASLYKDAQYKGNDDKLQKRALYCKMAISHAVNIKSFCMKALIENEGIAQTPLVCPPPMLKANRGYVIGAKAPIGRAYVPLSPAALKLITKPLKTRAKRSHGKRDCTSNKVAHTELQKTPYTVHPMESAFSLFGPEEEDEELVFLKDDMTDEETPTGSSSADFVFDEKCILSSFAGEPLLHSPTHNAYWHMQAASTVDLNDIELFHRDDIFK